MLIFDRGLSRYTAGLLPTDTYLWWPSAGGGVTMSQSITWQEAGFRRNTGWEKKHEEKKN